MHRTASDARTRACQLVFTACFAAAAVLAPTPSRADEDGMKLRDRQPPFKGPIVTGAQALALTGGGSPGDHEERAFDARNIRLLSWIPLSGFPGSNASAADCWGYTSPSGREYALIGLERGTGVVEITDPSNPVIIGFIGGAVSLWHDVTVIGTYAYVGSEGGRGVQVIDLSRVDEGVVTHVQDKMQGGHSSTHTLLSNTESGHLYACGSNISNGGLVAFDAKTDPADPTIAGAWSYTYVHESQIVTYTEGPWAGREIAYNFCGGSGLFVVDVTDKSRMVTIGSLAYSSLGYCHQGWLTDDRKYLYINDELDEYYYGYPTRTRVVDVSDPTNPRLVSEFGNGLSSIDHNLYVHGKYIYESNYRTGLRIFDATDPLAPTEIAYIDTRPEDDGIAFNGDWGNYGYFPSGTIIISDLERGLFVVKLDLGSLSFTFPSGLPSVLPPQAATPVDAQLAEIDGAVLDPSSVRLWYSVGTGSPLSIDMTDRGGGLYSASIPGADCLAHVDYWFTASTTDGKSFSSPAGAPDSRYPADVITGKAVIFTDDLEVDRGWTLASSDLASGEWIRVNPRGTDAQPEDDTTPGSGVRCWVTGQGSTGDIGEADVDGGPARLVSPAIDLSGAADALISYMQWFYNDDGDDSLTVEVSNDDGASWKTVQKYATTPGWVPGGFRVASYVAPSAAVRVRFSTSDNPNNSITEAAIDDFAATRLECSVCDVDFNRDGKLDVNDFIAFQAAWKQRDPRADWDKDGKYTIRDFVNFQGSFVRGCT